MNQVTLRITKAADGLLTLRLHNADGQEIGVKSQLMDKAYARRGIRKVVIAGHLDRAGLPKTTKVVEQYC